MGGLLTRCYLRYGGQDLPADGSLPATTWEGARDEDARRRAPPSSRRRCGARLAEGGEDHGDRKKLALERVETQAQRLERERAEENGVPRLAEDHLGDRVAIPVPEEGNSTPAHDARRVRQVELPLPARREAEPREDLPWHHRVDRSGIDQELDLLGDLGRDEVRHLHADAGEPHLPTVAAEPPVVQAFGPLGAERGGTTRDQGRPRCGGHRVQASHDWNTRLTRGVRRVRL